MTDTRRKPAQASPQPSRPRPESSSHAASGREPDPTEFYNQMLDRLDELGRRLAKVLGRPVEAVNGSLTRE